MRRITAFTIMGLIICSTSWAQAKVDADSLSRVVDSLLTKSKGKSVKIENIEKPGVAKVSESADQNSATSDANRTQDFPLLENFKSKLTVAVGDTLSEDKTIIAGDVLIEGIVTGNLKVYGGNVWIKATGNVSGNILVSGGQIRVDKGASVSGSLTEISLGGIELKKAPLVDKWFEADGTEKEWEEDSWQADTDYEDSTGCENGHKISLGTGFGESFEQFQNPDVRYNRQEGLFIPLRTDFNLEIGVKFRGYVGYGFGNKKMRYGAGLTIPLFTPKFLADLSVYDRSTSADMWRLTGTENSLVAFFFGEDYLDYYEARGVSGNFFIRPFKHGVNLRIGAYSEDQSSMPNVTTWGLFAKDRFRPDFIFDSLKVTALTAHLEFGINPWRSWGTRDTYFNSSAKDYLGTGFSVELDAEKTLPDYSDTDFQIYKATAHMAWTVSRDFILYCRTVFATSDRALIPQRNNDLGGYGTLRGLRFREIPGDQSVLNTVELWIGNHDSFFIDPYLVLFLDSGFARSWIATPTTDQWQRFKGIRVNDLRHSAGASIMDDEDHWRLSVARELQNSSSDWRFELRLQARL